MCSNSVVIPTGCHARCAGTVRALLESLVRTDRTWLGEKGLREGPEGLPGRRGSGGSDVKLNADGGGAQTPPTEPAVPDGRVLGSGPVSALHGAPRRWPFITRPAPLHALRRASTSALLPLVCGRASLLPSVSLGPVGDAPARHLASIRMARAGSRIFPLSSRHCPGPGALAALNTLPCLSDRASGSSSPVPFRPFRRF